MNKQQIISTIMQSFLIIFVIVAFATQAEAQENKTRYVLAPSGLNLRESNIAKSAKVGHIAYGEKLTLVKPSYNMSMEVDQIKGGMAKVTYNGKSGYVFDGYLSSYPTPKILSETKPYVEQLRDLGIESLYEECHRDYDGYFQHETSFTLPGQNWPQAFLIGQQLHKVPKSFKLPRPSATMEDDKTIENPIKNKNAWTDEIFVEYDENGQIALLEYRFRTEGHGHTVSWEYDERIDALKIISLAIAD